jgi:hypothetical protein
MYSAELWSCDAGMEIPVHATNKPWWAGSGSLQGGVIMAVCCQCLCWLWLLPVMGAPHIEPHKGLAVAVVVTTQQAIDEKL